MYGYDNVDNDEKNEFYDIGNYNKLLKSSSNKKFRQNCIEMYNDTLYIFPVRKFQCINLFMDLMFLAVS